MKTRQAWDSKLSVGFPVIDNQHKVLFDLIRDLNNAIRAGENMRVLDSLLSVLLNYAFQHFEAEEKYYVKHRDYLNHCMEHYQLIKKLNNFIVDFRNNRPIGDKTPSDFLENWLVEHIEQYDKHFFKDATVDQGLVQEKYHQPDEFEPEFTERRKHKRIHHDQVVDGDIKVQCYNASRLKGNLATIMNMSSGGLMLKSREHHDVDDLLVISCSIGSSFKMKEKVTVRTVNGDLYGVEFVSPASETVDFLTQLYGAVHFRHHRTI